MKRVFAGLLFLAVVFFNVVILKPTADGDVNSDLKVPDITFLYNGTTIYNNFFLKLEHDIIPTYKKNMMWDYPYPIIYTAFLLLMGQILFRKNLFRMIFFTLAVTAFIFDIAENITQLYLINQLPVIHYSLGSLMGIFTAIKWIAVLFVIFSVLAGLVQVALKKISTAKQ